MHPTDFSSNLHEFSVQPGTKQPTFGRLAVQPKAGEIWQPHQEEEEVPFHSDMGPLWQFWQLFVLLFLVFFSKWLFQDQIEAVKWCATLGCLTICIRYQIYRYLILFTIISLSSPFFSSIDFADLDGYPKNPGTLVALRWDGCLSRARCSCSENRWSPSLQGAEKAPCCHACRYVLFVAYLCFTRGYVEAK